MSSEGVTTQRIPEVRVSTHSGSITVVGESRADVVADGPVRMDVEDDGSIKITSKKGSSSLTIRCPEGSDVVVGTHSGSLTLKGRLGAARVTTMSGSIKAEQVSSADIRARSGSVEVVTC